MRQNDATTRQSDATIGDTAKALGVSVRTIQRRIERGQMNVSERDGKRFVELASVAQASATVTRQSATVDATPRQNDATERDSDRHEMEVELRAQLAREREFSAILKAQLEDSNRNAAELRAALRKALDIAPKQLTTGTPEPMEAAPESAKSAAVNDDSTATADGAQRPSNRRGDGLKSVRDGLRQMFMRK